MLYSYSLKNALNRWNIDQSFIKKVWVTFFKLELLRIFLIQFSVIQEYALVFLLLRNDNISIFISRSLACTFFLFMYIIYTYNILFYHFCIHLLPQFLLLLLAILWNIKNRSYEPFSLNNIMLYARFVDTIEIKIRKRQWKVWNILKEIWFLLFQLTAISPFCISVLF